MAAAAHFLRFANAADLRAGDARALRITGIGTDDEDDTVVVVLDADDNVRRLHQGGEETTVVPWNVQQVLFDLLDPHD